MSKADFGSPKAHSNLKRLGLEVVALQPVAAANPTVGEESR